MTPSLLTAFFGDGWLYLAYSDGKVVRKFMKEDLPWELVETPKFKNFAMQVLEKKPQRL